MLKWLKYVNTGFLLIALHLANQRQRRYNAITIGGFAADSTPLRNIFHPLHPNKKNLFTLPGNGAVSDGGVF